jgi:hypothetical protein
MDEQYFQKYCDLLVLNQNLNKTNPRSREHKDVDRKLLELELKMTSSEIIFNTKITFPEVTPN